jgi:nucleoside-diphosphate-sugar epimerase
MLWLVYGHRGWIGDQIIKILAEQGETVVYGQTRANDYVTAFTEIQVIHPDRIICAIGRTYGLNYPNSDYLEQPGKLIENIRDNLQGPIMLAQICRNLNIHLTYFGTGCIFEYDATHQMNSNIGYTENDRPNFFDSSYSVVKGATDEIMKSFADTVLNVRIRNPVIDQIHPRNFITKITKYPKIISIPNSITVLPELLPIMIDMAKKSVKGTINLCNPGVISHKEILDIYKEIIDPQFTYEIIELKDLKNHVVSGRANNYLDTSLLESQYKVTPIKDAIIKMITAMNIKNIKK